MTSQKRSAKLTQTAIMELSFSQPASFETRYESYDLFGTRDGSVSSVDKGSMSADEHSSDLFS